MRNGSMQKTILILIDIFKRIDIPISLEKIEQIATIIHKAMAVSSRNYHTLEHALSLTGGIYPIQDLSALFHDIVYFQVDKGLIPDIEKIISPYVSIRDDSMVTLKHSEREDRGVNLLLGVFGFYFEQDITLNDGANEFLSSLVMNKLLEGILPEKYLILCSTCIEATIPFRENHFDKTHPQVLEERLIDISDKYQVEINYEEIKQGINQAVSLANKDVSGFCVPDPRLFLNDTWKLLPETNAFLRIQGFYSIREYRSALQRMEVFLRSINPNQIFLSYRGNPPDETLNEMISFATNNVSIAENYLGVKLMGIAIIEALAEITGGDAPVSLFMGDMNEKEGEYRMEDLLPKIEINTDLDYQSTVLSLLEHGRTVESVFDMKYSPLSSYIYKIMGQTKTNILLNDAKRFFEKEITAIDFLNLIDSSIVSALAKACSKLAITRQPKIKKIISIYQ